MKRGDDLEAVADDLLAAKADGRTPGVVRTTLLGTAPALTLRQYLRLEEEGSPLLSGAWPVEPREFAEAFAGAWAVVFPGRDYPAPAHLDTAAAEMGESVRRSFSTLMAVRVKGVAGATPSEDPTGWVPRVLARALGGLGLALGEVLEMRLDVLWMLLAGLALNEGAEAAGTPYAYRGLAAEGAEDPHGQGTEGQGAEEKPQGEEPGGEAGSK